MFELCHRLDGMPLALELAAVRLRTIGLDDLLERLTDRFAILTGGSRTALPRQQSLGATIDWSHDLLSGPEAALLRRLAVFPSDFGLDAAEAVATGTGIDPTSVLDLLSSLIDKSFVARLGAAASARYRFHETMREYGLLKLRDAGEEVAAINAFVRFYAGLCRDAEEAAPSREVVEWLKRLDGEADNVRAALARCLNGPDHALGLSMVGSLYWYWVPRATSEGVYWLDLFLERPEDDASALARALFARGFVAMAQGDATTAQPVLREAEAKARTMRDLPLLARILAVSATVRAMSGDFDGARSCLRDAKVLADGLDDPGADAVLALTEGFLALSDTDVDTVSRVYSEWAPRMRDRGDLQSLSYLLGLYGFSLLQSAQPDKGPPAVPGGLEHRASPGEPGYHPVPRGRARLPGRHGRPAPDAPQGCWVSRRPCKPRRAFGSCGIWTHCFVRRGKRLPPRSDLQRWSLRCKWAGGWRRTTRSRTRWRRRRPLGMLLLR